MSKTILVTGGAGFIGSHLVDTLLSDNKIIVIDNFENFYDRSYKENNIKAHHNNPNYTLIEADIRSTDSLNTIFKSYGSDITNIVHLAAKAGVRPSIQNPEGYVSTNINGTVNILEMARKYNINHLVFASSSSVYGEMKKGPFNEEMLMNRPISPYASTKLAGEQICHTYSHLFNMTISCLRFFTVYGPRQRPDLAIHKFFRLISEGKQISVYGDGTAKRDFTFIDDIIQGIVAAINYNKTKYEVFNLGESREIELKYLISLIEENLGKQANISKQEKQPGDVPITYADITKAKELLGYNPQVHIEEGMKKFMEWFNSYYNLLLK